MDPKTALITMLHNGQKINYDDFQNDGSAMRELERDLYIVGNWGSADNILYSHKGKRFDEAVRKYVK